MSKEELSFIRVLGWILKTIVVKWVRRDFLDFIYVYAVSAFLTDTVFAHSGY
jgi:hypothetical protein